VCSRSHQHDLGVRHPDSERHGLPGEQALHPPRPGLPEYPASLHRQSQDRRLRADESLVSRERLLRHDGAQEGPLSVVRPRELEVAPVFSCQ
jgi:hypothetical protein